MVHQFIYEARPSIPVAHTGQLNRLSHVVEDMPARHHIPDDIYSTLARSVLAASETPLLVLDETRTIVAASPAAVTLLETNEADLVGKPLDRCANGLFARRDPTRTLAPRMALIRTAPGRLLATRTTATTYKAGRILGWVVRLYEAPEPAQNQPSPVSLVPQGHGVSARERWAPQRHSRPPALATFVLHPLDERAAGLIDVSMPASMDEQPTTSIAGVTEAAPRHGRLRLLGSYLLEAGVVTETQLRAALVIQRQRTVRGRPLPLGEILLQQGTLTPAALGHVLALQTRDAIGSSDHVLSCRLGTRLLENGHISVSQLARALAEQSDQRARGSAARLGEILIAQDVLTPRTLHTMLYHTTLR